MILKNSLADGLFVDCIHGLLFLFSSGPERFCDDIILSLGQRSM